MKKTTAGFAVATLAVLGIAGCTQSKPDDSAAQTDLKIVAQMPVDQNGAEVTLATGTTPISPAGDGKAN